MKFDTLQDHEFRRDEWAAQERDAQSHRCPAQACCLLEGHEGSHRCSVCNWPHRLDATEAAVLASEKYEEHECYPMAETGFVADPDFGRVDVVPDGINCDDCADEGLEVQDDDR